MDIDFIFSTYKARLFKVMMKRIALFPHRFEFQISKFVRSIFILPWFLEPIKLNYFLSQIFVFFVRYNAYFLNFQS